MIHPDLGFRRFASVSWFCFYLLMKVEPPLCTSPWWGEESHLPGLLISNNNCSDSNNSNRAPIYFLVFVFEYLLCLRGFPHSKVNKDSACTAGDRSSIPGSGRSPGEGNATHSSILAWEIPWTEEPGGLQSMGLQRVGINHY